ncbi:hypothetical protein KDA_23860 [Dictyobacter alpinus]|uniref:Glycosyl hydrolase-like 10 domain-containing protein n=2 Tax=Dictyobacter alpinus TaxID=2014873 RepID=A0A402B6D1_9CHLR|nr:hypothetical protein KDA_23860 [Dictyobacter alpinus]
MGVWIATVKNIDWPSRAGLTADAQRSEFRKQLDKVQAMHLNTVVVQVKPEADALYPSKYAPWSRYLTGVQGKDPGYNPLAFMVTEAHQRGLSFHAWFNPFRVAMNEDVKSLAPNHPARVHPDWLVHYGGKLYYNPGIPEAREFVINSILEVVQSYPIDAVHLDDYFYPYRVPGMEFPDQAQYKRYGAQTFADKGNWRRDNINRFVGELSQRIKQVKSSVEFGISPFGVWRNKAQDPTGSQTQAGVTNYDDLYADTRHWIQQGWLDYIVPQIYWKIGFKKADYETLVRWWAHEVDGSRVKLYIGQAAYRVDEWHDPNQLQAQLRINQRYPQVRGSIFFSLKDLLRHPIVVPSK